MSLNEEPPGVPPAKPALPFGRALPALVVGLVLVSGFAGMMFVRWVKPSQSQAKAPPAARPEPTGIKMPADFFRGWDKPDLVLVLSGSQHGYLLPCGCSSPQYGGLERRYNFVQALRQRGWTVAAVDVGDIPQKEGPRGLSNEQGRLKYVYSMKALKQIGYSAVSIGEYEAALPLADALGYYALNFPEPRVLAANLEAREQNFPEQVKDWQEIKENNRPLPIRTGVTAVIGPTVARRINDPLVRFTDAAGSLKSIIPAMQNERIELRILLYQGSATSNAVIGAGVVNGNGNQPRSEAVAIAEKVPQFHVVLGLNEEEEPSGQVSMANHGKTLVTGVGHKGRYVGVVGVWRTGNPAKPFSFKYQLAEMSEHFITPTQQEKDHPIISLLEDYTTELKQQNYLAHFGQKRHPYQAEAQVAGVAGMPAYVGSQKCRACHKKAYDVWQKSKHSHAYASLVNAKRPSLREYDAECIVCHTVGFGYLTGFSNATATPKLMNVGCESCHGPGSLHAANKDNVAWQERMNPWKKKANEAPAERDKRFLRMDNFCQGCHNEDNDVTWKHDNQNNRPAVDKKWPLIAHDD